MNGTKRINPLDKDALTCDAVKPGDHIICWRPGVANSVRRFTILNGPYNDDDSTMVVDVKDKASNDVWTLPTSEVGLTGQRYDGRWTHIARYDEDNES